MKEMRLPMRVIEIYNLEAVPIPIKEIVIYPQPKIIRTIIRMEHIQIIQVTKHTQKGKDNTMLIPEWLGLQWECGKETNRIITKLTIMTILKRLKESFIEFKLVIVHLVMLITKMRKTT